ncbi:MULTISPECIES: hypothetical protein [Parafrankia]|uniref:hypothetical protein n=1 Tax=Parafrankia TaxID=2994362 RepID=UPI0010426D17|nr:MULTISPECIES: hypothetical protein [Parafrankia]MBE3200186.1 hypothetical protein [Parafrankia sp. CH37]
MSRNRLRKPADPSSTDGRAGVAAERTTADKQVFDEEHSRSDNDLIEQLGECRDGHGLGSGPLDPDEHYRDGLRWYTRRREQLLALVRTAPEIREFTGDRRPDSFELWAAVIAVLATPQASVLLSPSRDVATMRAVVAVLLMREGDWQAQV